jgi:hypothetical protein
VDFVTILLIIVALGLIGAYAYIKVRERREDDLGSGAPARPTPRSSSVAVEDLTDLDEEDEQDEQDEQDEEVDVLDDRPSSSSWLEEIAVRDDDALADLEALADAPAVEEIDEAVTDEVTAEAYDLDTTTVDEEFESLTADLEVDVEPESTVVVKEEVETADDIMANSKATEINPAGNTELQNLLQKVQARLSQYE